jgi:hypothetical protein
LFREHNKFNMELNDDAMIVEELKKFKEAGGSGIVEALVSSFTCLMLC